MIYGSTRVGAVRPARRSSSGRRPGPTGHQAPLSVGWPSWGTRRPPELRATAATVESRVDRRSTRAPCGRSPQSSAIAGRNVMPRRSLIAVEVERHGARTWVMTKTIYR